MHWETYRSIAISLRLGLPVGSQRQWSASEIAGFRAFPLISLLGTLAALLAG